MLSYLKRIFYPRPRPNISELASKIESAIKNHEKYQECHSITRVEARLGQQDETTYDGSCWYWYMLKVAYDCLREEYETKDLEVVNAQRIVKYSDNPWTEERNHPYIVIKCQGEPLIVDILLRMIFMLHRGYGSKWISTYANHLYSEIPICWIGTYDKLYTTWQELSELRKTDSDHNTQDDNEVLEHVMDFFDLKKQVNNVVKNLERLFPDRS